MNNTQFKTHFFLLLTFSSISLIADKLFGKSFRPPEVYQKRLYNPVKVDVFCMGWMLFFTVTKHQLFDRAVESDEHWKLLKHGKYDELLKQRGGSYLTKSLTQLLWKMVHPDPRQRPTARECLNHPWFSGTLDGIDVRNSSGHKSRH